MSNNFKRFLKTENLHLDLSGLRVKHKIACLSTKSNHQILEDHQLHLHAYLTIGDAIGRRFGGWCQSHIRLIAPFELLRLRKRNYPFRVKQNWWILSKERWYPVNERKKLEKCRITKSNLPSTPPTSHQVLLLEDKRPTNREYAKIKKLPFDRLEVNKSSE